MEWLCKTTMLEMVLTDVPPVGTQGDFFIHEAKASDVYHIAVNYHSKK
jgi:hypothetical protein